MTIGWEEDFTAVNESQGVLELCVVILNITGNAFPEDIAITLAAITIPGTAAGWLLSLAYTSFCFVICSLLVLCRPWRL